MSAAATLYVVSAVLEVGGIIKTVWDIRAARQHLRDYIRRPVHVYASNAAVAAEAYNASVVTSEPKTLERRVEDLEKWKVGVPEELSRRDREVTARLDARLQGDLDATRRSVQARLMEVSEYLEGGLQSATVSYWGPVALFVGVVVGFCGNLVALG
ncbi:hypothetical protein J7E93_23475 [Streptomyces sp. ISL-36]|uniref:hypothetical protein n=1 Tax=Streptomyces sp. ISL-36 TaxID=2819182 RepID=UPI001BEA9D7E|nr:hypothetical protein [Streptomyces sp. ISL-36]MBT2443012.1 hypothetical protein [Streptomyces sp. ISL-36]